VSALRSDGWIVRPSFAPHGPTAPVAILLDDVGFTQLTGAPAVAWQTPWSEITHLRLVRRRTGVTIIAVISNVLYQWRRVEPASRAQIDELAAVLGAHGAREMPRSRRNSALAVAVLVSLASFGGYFGALFSPASSPATLSALERVNITALDVSGTWASSTASSTSELNTIMSTPGQVLYTNPSTSTTIPAQDSTASLAAVHFQKCLGVTNVVDRVYGLASQYPVYEVSSPVFSSNDFGGIQVESFAQYYDSTQGVAADVAEMSRSSFGRCFAQSNADLMIGHSAAATPDLITGANFAAHTFAKGWVRAGTIEVALPVIGIAHDRLVMIAEAAGHYEAYLAVLVVNLAPARATIDNLANAMLLRVTSTSTTSA
jgi:hypothetical protein